MVPGGRDAQTSGQSAHKGGKVYSPTPGRLYTTPTPPGNIPGNHLC